MLLLISLVFSIISLRLLYSYKVGHIYRIVACLLLLANFLLTGLLSIAVYFNGRGIDESVIYHIDTDILYAGILEYSDLLLFGSFYIISVLLLVIVVNFSARAVTNTLAGAKQHFVIIPALLALFVNPASADLYRIYFSQEIKFNNYPEFSVLYKSPAVSGNPNNNQPYNLVFIYLESLERTYFDRDIFPDLIEQLNTVENHSLAFTDLTQYPLAGWTVAGMTASLCGLPLVTSSAGNSMEGVDYFLPGATCLGDILEKNGYNLTYLGGASLEFSGKGSFFRTHGFTRVLGYTELAQESGDNSYRSRWGLYDDSLFSIAGKELDDLASRNKPFGLFLLTLDTHHINGHPSKSCNGIRYKDGSNPILNAVKCTDVLASRFIQHIRDSDYSDNTLIVIASDHLAMRNTAAKQLAGGKRRNLFFINFPGRAHSGIISRPGSTFDIGATVLDALGKEDTALGFGRSLLKDRQNLVELGMEAADLHQYHTDIKKLWGLPGLSHGLAMHAYSREVRLGPRTIRAPLLLITDKNGGVTDIIFARESENLNKHLSRNTAQTPFLLVDYCSKLTNIVANTESCGNDPFYLVAGRTGTDINVIKAVKDDIALTHEQVINMLNIDVD